MDRRSFVTSALPAGVMFVLTAGAANALTSVAPPPKETPVDKNGIEHVWWRRRWHRRWRRW